MNFLTTSFSSFRRRIAKRTTLEKYLISALLMMSVVLIGWIIAFSLSSRKKNKDLVCQTPTCSTVGSAIRKSMDLKSDPCKDFYSFCCGGWESNHQIPKDMNKYGAIEELKIKVLHKIKDIFENGTPHGIAVTNAFTFYTSCMNTSAIESRGSLPFLQFTDEWGGWPVIHTNWSSKKFHPLSAIAKIQLKTGYGYILPIVIATDPKNTTRKLIQIDQPSLIISENILRKKNEESSKKDLKDFENFFSKVAVLLGAGKSNFSADFNSIINFEEKMLQMMSPPEYVEDINHWYNNMTLTDLQKKVPQINWIQYIQEITNSSLLSIDKGYEIHKKDIVIVRDLPYIMKVSEYIRNEKNSRQISIYLGWRVLTHLLHHLPLNFSIALEEYYRDSGYPLQTTKRWKTCINRINSAFGMVSAFLYVKEHFSIDVRNEVRKLILDLSYQFERRLLSNDWMDRKTKNAALQKLRAMKVNIGFPDWITDESNLDDYYIQTNMPTMDDDVLQNDLKLMEYTTIQVIKSLRVLPKREEWTMSPVTINAAYSRNTNSITFPAAFLQLPLYNSSLPGYFNYAAIGSIIGHEITHGFDSEGSKRNASGEIDNWWSKETKQIFENKSDCFVKQYNKYGLDGRQTLAENIADNGGLQQAYTAFLSWKKKEMSGIKLPELEEFSTDQLFFITYGSIWCTKYAPGVLNYTIREAEHAPSPYRLKITITNLKAFSDAFNCHSSISSFENYCSIW